MLAINRPTYAHNHGVFFIINSIITREDCITHFGLLYIYYAPVNFNSLVKSYLYVHQWPSDKSYLCVIYVLNFAVHLRPSYVPHISCMAFKCSACLKNCLTHWGRVTHICVGKLIIIGSDNGLSPDRRQVIIWTNARLLSIGPLRTYFNENLIKIQQFSLKKMPVKTSSAKWRPSCLGLNVLRNASMFYSDCQSLSCHN